MKINRHGHERLLIKPHPFLFGLLLFENFSVRQKKTYQILRIPKCILPHQTLLCTIHLIGLMNDMK